MCRYKNQSSRTSATFRKAPPYSMKFIALTVLSCALVLEASPLRKRSVPLIDEGIQVAKAIGRGFANLAGLNRRGNNNIGNGFGAGQVENGISEAGVDGSSFDNGRGFLEDGARNFGLDGFGLGGESQSSGYKRGSGQAAQNYDQGASGANGQQAHNTGSKEFHNIGQHHNKVTSVTQSEDDSSHNVGGSQSHDVGAHSGSQFNNHQNGAAETANDSARGEQQSDVVA